MVQPERESRSRWLIAALGLAFLVALLPALPARAAPAGGQLELLRAELDRTDQLLLRARDEIAGLRSSLPQTLLGEAAKLQKRAWDAFREGGTGGASGSQGAFRRARELTLLARERAVRAIEAAGLEHRAREGAGSLIDRAQERAAEAGERVQGSGNALAEQLLEQGLEQLRRARRALLEGDPYAARLATLALDLIERAGGVAAGQSLGVAALEASLDRTDTLLAQVEALLAGQGAGSAPAAQLREARALLQRAREELRAGHPRVTLRLSLQARKKGLEILTELKRLPDEQDLRAALEELESLHAEILAQSVAPAAERARELLAQAGRLLAEARTRIGEGRIDEALSVVVAAETLLREAAEAADLR